MALLTRPLKPLVMLSSIQVIQHVFEEIRIKSVLAESSEENLEARYAVRATPDEEKGERFWKVEMVYEFGHKKEGDRSVPYEGFLKLIGWFVIHPDFPENQCKSLALMNGGAVLMGAVREAVLNHTLRSSNGPLELPLVDARTFLPKKEQDKALIPKPSPAEDEAK